MVCKSIDHRKTAVDLFNYRRCNSGKMKSSNKIQIPIFSETRKGKTYCRRKRKEKARESSGSSRKREEET